MLQGRRCGRTFDDKGVSQPRQRPEEKEAAARRKSTSSVAVPGAEWVDGYGSRKSSKSSSPQHKLAAPKGPIRSEAEPANIDDVLAENFQLKEINQSVWREMHALRKRKQKETEDAETSRRKIQSAAGSIESLQEQLATSLSLVESMERDKEANESIIEDLQKMVTGLTDQLATTADELKAAKQENRRKSRQSFHTGELTQDIGTGPRSDSQISQGQDPQDYMYGGGN